MVACCKLCLCMRLFRLVGCYEIVFQATSVSALKSSFRSSSRANKRRTLAPWKISLRVCASLTKMAMDSLTQLNLGMSLPLWVSQGLTCTCILHALAYELYIQFHGCNVLYMQYMYVMVCINWQGDMFSVQCISTVLFTCTNNDVQYMYMYMYACHMHVVLL